jgi:hypothetical protein
MGPVVAWRHELNFSVQSKQREFLLHTQAQRDQLRDRATRTVASAAKGVAPVSCQVGAAAYSLGDILSDTKNAHLLYRALRAAPRLAARTIPTMGCVVADIAYRVRFWVAVPTIILPARQVCKLGRISSCGGPE